MVIVTIGHTDGEARKALPKQGPAARKPMEQFAHCDRFLRVGVGTWAARTTRRV